MKDHHDQMDEACRHEGGAGPNAGSSDPQDGRTRYQWKSEYPIEARRWIWGETGILFAIFMASLVFMFLAWKGVLCDWLGIEPGQEHEIFERYVFFSLGGLLGGAVFAIKWLYRAVARGFWHEDRRPWRLLTPWVSLAVALVVGALLQSNIWGESVTLRTGGAAVAVGFLSGYFADSMVAKMYEVANVLFGTVKAK